MRNLKTTLPTDDWVTITWHEYLETIGNPHLEQAKSDTSLVDLDVYPPPDLVIKIAKSSLSDDSGTKIILYELLRVAEYWVVNVRRASLMAFAIADGGTRPARRK